MPVPTLPIDDGQGGGRGLLSHLVLVPLGSVHGAPPRQGGTESDGSSDCGSDRMMRTPDDRGEGKDTGGTGQRRERPHLGDSAPLLGDHSASSAPRRHACQHKEAAPAYHGASEH